MEKFIFTFGCGQINGGRCQPIFAPNMKTARTEMVEQYGTAWSMAYTEEEWETAKQRAKERGYPIEKEMTPIYAGVTAEEKI